MLMWFNTLHYSLFWPIMLHQNQNLTQYWLSKDLTSCWKLWLNSYSKYTVAQNKPDTIKIGIISWCFIGPKILYYGVIGMTIGMLVMHYFSFWPCILCLICLHICTLAEYQIHAPKNPKMWQLWVLSDNIFWLSLD